MSPEESIRGGGVSIPERTERRQIIHELFQDEKLPKAASGIERARARAAPMAERELTPRPIPVVDYTAYDNGEPLTEPC